MKGIKGWFRDILIACIIALTITAFVKPTIVVGNSMQPTLYANDYIFLSRQAYLFFEPKVGDVVVFNSNWFADDNGEKLFIKRIIALSGDIVTIIDGNVYVNEVLIEELYIYEKQTSGNIDNLTVPVGKVFVMGDNRQVSYDSRSEQIGCVPISEIVGKAFFRLYPFNDIGVL